jgi:hypothetical protein
MKKKVGELYDKPIVIGNPNEFTKNEIPLNDLGGDSFDDGMEYYLVLDSVNTSGRYGFPMCSVIIDGKMYNNNNMGNIIAFNTSNKIFADIGLSKYEINSSNLSDTSLIFIFPKNGEPSQK